MSTPDSEHLLAQVVELVNDAKLERKDEKHIKLAQVLELALHRDASLLPEVVPMIVEFQLDASPSTRKYVLTFLRDVVKAHPQFVADMAPVVVYLLNDENEGVRKQCVLAASATFRGALRWLSRGGGSGDDAAAAAWARLRAMQDAVLAAIAAPPEVSTVVIKFAETVAVAFIGGRGLGPYAAREGDKSVHAELPAATAAAQHAFLRRDELEAEGHALVRRMTAWLRDGGPEGGPGFEKKHYLVLENALQNIASSKASVFDALVPALADAMERVVAPGAAAAGVPEGLLETAGQLRMACLKLLKVAPRVTPALRRLCAAAARGGGEDKARAAVDANATIRGLITVAGGGRGLTRGASWAAAGAGGGDAAATTSVELALAALARMPPPPPGHSQRETEALGGAGAVTYIEDLLAMSGVGVAVAGPEHASKKRARERQDSEGGENRKRQNVGWFETSSEAGEVAAAAVEAAEMAPAAIAAAAKAAPLANGAALPPLQEAAAALDGAAAARREGEAAAAGVEAMAVVEEEEKAAEKEEPAELDPIARGLQQAREAFERVVKAEDGAFLEGRAALQRKLVAKLGRMLCEADAAAGVGHGKALREIVAFLTRDYRRRFATAMALLNELYISERRAATDAALPPTPTHAQQQQQQRASAAAAAVAHAPAKAAALYDAALLSVLRHMPPPLLRSRQGQRLFARTLLLAPRLPDAAVNLVCDFCDRGTDSHEIQTGLVCLRDLVFYKPTARAACLSAALRFTCHKSTESTEVRTKAVRLVANMLWPRQSLRAAVEEFARDALESALPARAHAADGGGGGSGSAQATAPKPQDETELDFDEDEDDGLAPQPGGAAGAPQGGDTGAAAARRAAQRRADMGWQAEPETELEARRRLALYFALCARSGAMLAGLARAYADAPVGGAVRKGMEAELQALITAAAAKMGAPDVLALLSSAPAGADPLLIAALDRLVPLDTNAPPPELAAAARALRAARVALRDAAAAAEGGGGAKPEKGERRGDRGVEFVVPVLGGLAAEERDALLPQVLRALRPVVDAAFHRLTSPRAAPPVTPVGLLVTLHNFNIAATGVPMKKLTDAVGYCLENKAVFSSHVMREALDTMSKAAAEPGADGKGKRGLPLLFMRTVILAVQGYPELKQYIAVTLLPRLVQQEVWTQPRAWDGFVRIAKIMGTETGATSFIALMLLPAPQLREVLKTHKGIKELLKSYAAGVIKVDPAVKEVLGM